MDKLFFLQNKKIINFGLFLGYFVIAILCVSIGIAQIGYQDFQEINNAIKGTQFPIFTVLFLFILILMFLMYIGYWILARVLYYLSKMILKFTIDFGIFHNIVLIYSMFCTVGNLVNIFFIDKINIVFLVFINPVFILGYWFIFFVSRSGLKLTNKKSYIMTLIFFTFNLIVSKL
ncbi:hypothetical protein bsdE14_21030 [Clostridium omnivorum]|uniref:Yip1 domain-containing protein n=2 Tax=Clostridium omnivorum TaxID=1604902 RepID=A0ABQ5N629_9CLOT|nr:hypothetical protein bsdE14_21030 [Clostridium sp. E14]